MNMLCTFRANCLFSPSLLLKLFGDLPGSLSSDFDSFLFPEVIESFELSLVAEILLCLLLEVRSSIPFIAGRTSSGLLGTTIDDRIFGLEVNVGVP